MSCDAIKPVRLQSVSLLTTATILKELERRFPAMMFIGIKGKNSGFGKDRPTVVACTTAKSPFAVQFLADEVKSRMEVDIYDEDSTD